MRSRGDRLLFRARSRMPTRSPTGIARSACAGPRRAPRHGPAGEAAEHADAIVVGEGELGWPELVADLASGWLNRRIRPTDEVHPGRCADAALRPARHRALQPLHRADQPRLPVATATSAPRPSGSRRATAEAGREGHRRDPRHQRIWPTAVHRVRRRQHVRRQRVRQASCCARSRDARIALVHRDRRLGRR